MSDDEPRTALGALAAAAAEAALEVDGVGLSFVVVVGKRTTGPHLELSMAARLNDISEASQIMLWEFAQRLDAAVRATADQVLSKGGPSVVVRDVERGPDCLTPKAKA